METLEAGPLIAAFLISAVISLVTGVNRLAGGTRSRMTNEREDERAEIVQRH